MHLNSDDLEFIATILDSTISDYSAAIRARERHWPNAPGNVLRILEESRSRAADLRERIEARA